MSSPPPLAEICFDVIIGNLEMYSSLSESLPVELKERIFQHFISKIPATPNPASFPISSYPEDRYRDVQLVNRITCQRVIPLCFAMWSSLDYRFEKVKRLIEEEACDVNESDLEGFCPLHYAAIYGRVEACKLLLSHGADCTRRNNFGKTPADLAQDPRVQQMIKLRAALFRKDEIKELEVDLQTKRRYIAEAQKQHLREEFIKESQAITRLLQRRDEQRKKTNRPATPTMPTTAHALNFNVNSLM
eukprot:TRINITY_DN3954_c0_g1_i1.p1 TRINITY_DN3954_c0_g1~~TRINITY_DN3954_c0_g1_i1.p1  ORF type:complete len:266 (+),score=48.90 TRINITY_DN3954_c0_g1_i1:62-799(+)